MRLDRRRLLARLAAAAPPAALGLYGLAAPLASPALANSDSNSSDSANSEIGLAERLQRLRIGQMRKLEPAAAPVELPPLAFRRADGSTTDFAPWRGRATLVNFWATWCAPCVKELPSIERLAAAIEARGLADAVSVLAISLDRGSPVRPAALFADLGITRLELLHDPSMDLARVLELKGMPTTLVLDGEGREVARMLGDAEWDSAEAIAVLTAVAEARGAVET